MGEILAEKEKVLGKTICKLQCELKEKDKMHQEELEVINGVLREKEEKIKASGIYKDFYNKFLGADKVRIELEE